MVATKSLMKLSPNILQSLKYVSVGKSECCFVERMINVLLAETEKENSSLHLYKVPFFLH